MGDASSLLLPTYVAFYFSGCTYKTMPRPSLVHPVGDAGREFCMHVSNYAADLHAAFKVRVITSACGRLHDISRLLSSACTRCSANWGLRQTSVQAQCYYAAVVPLCILCRWPPVLGISGISLPCVDRDAVHRNPSPCIGDTHIFLVGLVFDASPVSLRHPRKEFQCHSHERGTLHHALLYTLLH